MDKYKACSLLDKVHPKFWAQAAEDSQFCQAIRYQNGSKGLVWHYINIDTMYSMQRKMKIQWTKLGSNSSLVSRYTLESGINVPLGLLIFEFFPGATALFRTYVRLKSYYISLHILGATQSVKNSRATFILFPEDAFI